MPDPTCTRYDCDCPTTNVIHEPSVNRTIHCDTHGRFHRDDGPAVRQPDRVAWYRHGRFHRDDGPAILLPDRDVSWWLLEGTPANPATGIDAWLTSHHPHATDTTRALLHDLTSPWPGPDANLADLYTAATAANHP